MAFKQVPDVHVLVPLRNTDGEVAERIRADVDAPGQKAFILLRGERPIVPDDVVNRIGHRRPLSAATLRGRVLWTHRASLAEPPDMPRCAPRGPRAPPSARSTASPKVTASASATRPNASTAEPACRSARHNRCLRGFDCCLGLHRVRPVAPAIASG